MILHTGEPTSESRRYFDRSRGGVEAVDRLSRRQDALGLDLPPKLEPYRQHLTHHAVWDHVGGETTTRADVLRALRLAGGAGVVVGLAEPEERRAEGGRVHNPTPWTQGSGQPAPAPAPRNPAPWVEH